MNQVTEILLRLSQHGGGFYAGEPITELEHALQTAWLAQSSGSSVELVVAALLHDYGHLLHDFSEDFTAQGIDDHHEIRAVAFLQSYFPPAVCDPIRLHVMAKRYLCTKDRSYLDSLSATSRQSLELQGGMMSEEELLRFEREPFWKQGLQLRLWDDQAKIPNRQVPNLESYVFMLEQVLIKPW